jgi:thiamine transport system permease protein
VKNFSAAAHNNKITLLALWLLPLGFLLVFYFYPLSSILEVSFSRAESNILSPFIDAFSSPRVKRVLWFSIWQATLSTFLTLIVGLPGAYLFARYDFKGKSLLRSLTVIPFVLPTLVVAAAFNSLLGPGGWVNLALMKIFELPDPPLQFVHTLYAILVAHIFYNTTIVLRMVGDFWSHIDPRLGQAAQVLGANWLRSLLRISAPILAPVIITAALLVFIFNFTSFGVILVLGGPRFATLEVEIFYQTVSLFNLPLAAVLAILQLLCTLGLTVIYTQLSARISRPLVLRPRKYTQKKLNTWQSRLFAIIMIVILATILITPLAALAARSVSRLGPEQIQLNPSESRITFDYYRELTINRRGSLFFVPPSTAIFVSISYAAATVLFALVLGIPAAWALSQNQESNFNRAIDPILMLPLGTSAVTLGLGFIVALNEPPLDLRASVFLIPIAHTLVAFPFVVRSLAPSLQSIRPRLRQAAQVLGASPSQVVKHVDLPIVARAIMVAAAFAFTISLGEFGATAMIARPEYPTIPVMIYRFISQPGTLNYGQALSLSTILMITTAISMLAIEKLRIADIGEF